ncbi:ABC transporter ATP-binding protein [Sphaerothrix gracilis]|uniref:ABC transporter ATP-binding protein n=1 Tax=Sphaerothrix gracilis TaxID=3151835 RepID=UPI0031FD122F
MAQTVSSAQKSVSEAAALDVELQQVFKVFEGDTAVQGVDLSIRQGEFFSILGPSGCGKTTTLRLISGFETPSAGDILIQGQNVKRIPAYRRPVNTVFQSYALFNHMTVWDNVAFGLKIKGCSRQHLKKRVAESLQRVKMETFAQRYPRQLSGGQQQRVALARALVNHPAVMLLDEPLGALDLKLRKQMQVELSALHRDLGITFVMVTHDQEEALSLSDRIAVMRDGRIEQIGSPSEIYERPNTAFVADFIGDTNLLAGQVEIRDPWLKVVTQSGLPILVSSPQAQRPSLHQVIDVSIRPEKIRLSSQGVSDLDNCFEGRVKHMMYLGTHIHCVVELITGDCLTVLQSNQTQYRPDLQTPVYASWSAKDCRALVA